ncbi:hypothetical protein [Achromobacter aloeverae]
MSQHHFKTNYRGHEVTITVGWDRPLRYFFMVIPKSLEMLNAVPASHHESCDGCDECDEMLYSNLYDAAPFALSLEHYREVLRNIGITVPESLFIEAERDSQSDVGNRIATHTADGQVSEHSC